jgi:hypothetical protein
VLELLPFLRLGDMAILVDFVKVPVSLIDIAAE